MSEDSRYEAIDSFDGILDQATSSLRDDEELRLDVRAELASHLEDRREDYLAKGHSPEEALDLARQSFGAPDEIARDLLAANRRRMKLRALARLALRAAVVPAGVLACVVVLAASLARLLDVARWVGSGGDMVSIDPGPAVVEDLPEESRLILLGDPARGTTAERQRAIWEAHPENAAFFGNYVTTLASEARPGHGDEVLESELRRGMELDPGNARHGFLLAGHYLAAAAQEDWPAEGEYELIVKDRALLDRAMAEYVTASRMPRMDTYAREVLTLRLKLLPPEARVEDRMLRWCMAAGLLLPDLACHRQLARVAPRYARMLAAEGRKDEARAVLDSWFGHVSLMVDGSWSLIHLLVVNAVLADVEKDWARAYRELGDAAAAEETVRLVRRIAAPVRSFREGLGPSGDAAREAEVEEADLLLWRSGSTYARLLTPARGDEARSLSAEALAPGAQLEHTLLEEAGLVAALGLVLLAMLSALLVALRWRASLGEESRPLLVLPSWRDGARVLGLGVVAPLVGFLVYTRWSGLAGREFALTYLLPRFVVEIVLLAVTILLLTVWLGSAFVRRRILDAGGEAPPDPRARRIGFAAALAALWAAWLFARGEASAYAVGAAEAAIIGLALLVILAVGAMRAFFRRDRRWGRFYGSAARTLLPLLAGAAVLVAILAYPHLRARERDLLRRDELMAIDPDEPALTKPERDLVRRLSAGTRRAVAEVRAERARGE